mgnify:FL=1
MSSKENRMLFLFLMVVINVFGLIAGIYIGMSQILINSRYGFITIIFVVAGIADYFLLKYRDRRIEDHFLQRYSSAEEEARKYKDRLAEVAEERDNYRDRLEYYTKGTVKEEYDNLRQKCEAIETFRNSFPYKIADGYVLYNIMRTDLQVGHASTWQIVGDYNGELWEISIVRPLSQTYKEMLTLVAATAEPNQIASLNQSTSLLWQ